MASIHKHLPFAARTLTTSSIKNQQPPSLVKLKKIQADFQCADGRPVWLKGGFCDRVLSGSTIILSYIGVLMSLGFIYDQAKPASWRDPAC